MAGSQFPAAARENPPALFPPAGGLEREQPPNICRICYLQMYFVSQGVLARVETIIRPYWIFWRGAGVWLGWRIQSCAGGILGRLSVGIKLTGVLVFPILTWLS